MITALNIINIVVQESATARVTIYCTAITLHTVHGYAMCSHFLMGLEGSFSLTMVRSLTCGSWQRTLAYPFSALVVHVLFWEKGSSLLIPL